MDSDDDTPQWKDAPPIVRATGEPLWFSPDVVTALSAVPQADVRYFVRSADLPPGASPCADGRHHVWLGVHVLEKDVARVTVVRLDNRLDARDEALVSARCPSDAQWASIDGWKHRLRIDISWAASGGVRQATLVVPRNPQMDTYTAEVRLPDISHATINRDTRREIPRRIIQVVHDRAGEPLLPVLAKLTGLMRLSHPHWEHRIYAADEMPALVEAWAGPRTRAALETLQPMAYKADLFRVVALNAIGGVWADSKLVPVRSLDAPGVLPSSGAFFPMDIGYAGVWNGLLAAPRGDALMGLAAEMILHNVDTRWYGTDILDPTGPHLVLRAFNALPADVQERYTRSAVLDGAGVFIVTDGTRALANQSAKSAVNPQSASYPKALLAFDGEPLFVVHNGEYRRRCTYNKRCHYAPVWLARAVYSEAPCDPETGVAISSRAIFAAAAMSAAPVAFPFVTCAALLGLGAIFWFWRRSRRSPPSSDL